MSNTSSKHSLRSLSLLTRRIGTLVAIAAVTVTTACSTDSISAPRDIPSAPAAENRLADSLRAVLNKLIIKEGLQRTTALARPVTISKLIRANQGGRIELKDLGLRIDIPQGAIPRDTMTITVTALAGKFVAYDFQPHGTKFKKALEFEQELDNTNWEGRGIKTTLFGGYFKNANQLDLLNGKVLLDELLPAFVLGGRVEFNIWHFSGYMVSMD